MNFSKKKKKRFLFSPFSIFVFNECIMAGGFALISGEFSAGQVGKGRNHYTYISLRLLINSTHFWYGISATLSLIPDDTYRVNYLSARYQVIRRRKLDHAWECGAGGRKDWPETLFSACDSPIFFPSSFWYPPSSSSSSFPGNGE